MNKIQARFEDVREFTKDGITVIVLPKRNTQALIGAKGVYMLWPEQDTPVSKQVQKAFETIQSGAMQPLECPENPLLMDELCKAFQDLCAVHTGQDKEKSAHTAATVVNAKDSYSIPHYQNTGEMSSPQRTGGQNPCK